jgi:short-subunit dehydrogenase
MRSLKTAVVTGGAKGIGRAISERLAADGWDLQLSGRDRPSLVSAASELTKKYDREIKIVESDLSESEGVRAIVLAWGTEPPQALICNAGDYGTLGKLSDINIDEWQKSFDLNFFATARLIQAYLRACRDSKGTSRRKIVVMSGSGLGGSQVHPGISAYACAKSALYRLVEVLHEEVKDEGIDVNCVAPGFVKTGITGQAVQAGKDKLGELFEMSDRVQREGGTAPEVAAEAISLLLDASSDGISGRLISAKWDREILTTPGSADQIRNDADLLRLRRIDNDLFSRNTKS